jgi:hypothetical protein
VLGTLSNWEKSDWRSLAQSSQTCTSLRCTGLSSVHPTVSGAQIGALANRSLLGKCWWLHCCNSLDCPMCTRLSGVPATHPANDQPRDQRVTRSSANGQKVAPDYPMCHRGWWLQQSASPEKEGNHALFTVRWGTGLSGAPTDRRQPKPFKWNSNGS